jgi:hypothetical protein
MVKICSKSRSSQRRIMVGRPPIYLCTQFDEAAYTMDFLFYDIG